MDLVHSMFVLATKMHCLYVAALASFYDVTGLLRKVTYLHD